MSALFHDLGAEVIDVRCREVSEVIIRLLTLNLFADAIRQVVIELWRNELDI